MYVVVHTLLAALVRVVVSVYSSFGTNGVMNKCMQFSEPEPHSYGYYVTVLSCVACLCSLEIFLFHTHSPTLSPSLPLSR